ncbi:ABC transporter permease [Dehalobacter sp. DCM]|uniref:ABC transporter permease n=1 Tax=Dehalobacter sp. DCM TaxID=2907827 RepID=UPI003081C78C|nr:ABC transporter permease [Dehalobacter sp. DCM]
MPDNLKQHRRAKNKPYFNFGQKILIIIRGSVFPVIVLLLWEMAVDFSWVSVFFLPAPSDIVVKFFEMMNNGLWQQHLLASLSRLLNGFLLTIIIAVPIGLAVGSARGLRHWISPTLNFLQHIPPIAWIPIFMLWLGIDEASKIAVIVYASFFPVFLNTVQGVSSVDPKLIEVGRAYMFTPWEMVKRVYIPSAGIPIFVGLRLGLSNCWRALVMAEMIAATRGIGSIITEGRELAQPHMIFVGVFTIGLAGMLIDYLVRVLEHRLMPWKKIVQAGEQQ